VYDIFFDIILLNELRDIVLFKDFTIDELFNFILIINHNKKNFATVDDFV